MVEVFPDLSGIDDFDSAWEKRIEAVLDPDRGLKAFFISFDDLIAAKPAAARPQDLADVDAIRKAAESQGPKPPKKRRRNRHWEAVLISSSVAKTDVI